MKLKTIIIGSGFSSLSASCYLAQAGYDVTILEKNATVGGRARQLKRDGFTFDLGPSWYWMPDVFERFFSENFIDICGHSGAIAKIAMKFAAKKNQIRGII